MIRMSQLVAFVTLSFGVGSLLVACSDDAKPQSGSSSGNNDDGDSGTGKADSGSSGKAIGEGCANDEGCASGHCFIGGAGGGGGGTDGVCTLTCANAQQDPAPECQGQDALTGKCNGKKFCQSK